MNEAPLHTNSEARETIAANAMCEFGRDRGFLLPVDLASDLARAALRAVAEFGDGTELATARARIARQIITINGYREQAASNALTSKERMEEIARLRALVTRITDTAQALVGETTDPGTEALAAIHCGRNFVYD